MEDGHAGLAKKESPDNLSELSKRGLEGRRVAYQ